jgi:hypothetical protein
MKLHILPLLAAGALAVTGIAIAQNAAAPAGKVLGKASQVQGLVTVSQGATVGSVTDNAAIYAGSRIVTGSTGKVDLDFIDGCQVKLAPNQSITLPDDKPCDDRKLAVLWLDGGAVVASAAGAGGVSPLVGLAAVAGAAIVGNAINSGGGATGGGGTTPGGGGTTPGGGGGGIPNPPLSGQ